MTRISRPTRTLPEHPDLDQLRRQAKELLDAFQSGDADASAEVNAHYRDATTNTFALHDAQLVLARAYGFDSWPRLKAHVDGMTARQFIEAARTNDVDRVAAMLKVRRDLVDMQWSYGDERRALHHAVMNAACRTMVRLLMRARRRREGRRSSPPRCHHPADDGCGARLSWRSWPSSTKKSRTGGRR